MPLPWKTLQHKPKKRSHHGNTEPVSLREGEGTNQGKRVKFSDDVSYQKIENSSAAAEHSLHYSHSDYYKFKFSAIEEIRRMKLKYQDMSTKQVIRMLYQPATRDHNSLNFESSDTLSSISPRPHVIIIPGTTKTQLSEDGTTSFIRTAVFLFRKGSHRQYTPEAPLTQTVMEYI